MVKVLHRLSEDMKVAMKERDKFTLSVIRMLRSELKYAEIAAKQPLNEDQVTEVLARELKKRKDAAAEYAAAGRADTADSLAKEQKIIQNYLPAPLTEGELRNIVSKAVQEVGAQSPADFGKVMGKVMPQVKGKADGNQVSDLVRQLIGK